MKTRIQALLCAVCITAGSLSLCSCSGSGASGKAVGVSGEDGAFAKYSEPVKLSMLYESNVGVTYPDNDSSSDNEITRFIADKLNVTFDTSWTVDSGNYSTQLDLAIASNTDLPDIFTATRQQVYTLAAAGLIWDMTDIYGRYASENLKNTLSFGNSQGLKSGTVLDKLCGIPLTNDVGDGVSLTFIRKDWLDKLGLAVPESMNELVDVARKFVDGNVSGAKAGTLGISMAKDLGFTFDAVANACGAYPDLWVNEGGTLSYGSLSGNMKTALGFMNNLYNQGLINKEFAAQDTSKLAQYVAQGRLGIFIGPFWYNNNYIINNLTADEKAQWTVVSNLPLNKGEATASRAWNTSYRWLVVNKKCANPEAAIKVMNLWYEMWQGEYSEWYFGLQNSDKYKEITLKDYAPVFFDPPMKNCTLGVELRQAAEAGNPDSLNPENKYNYQQYMLNDNSAIFRSARLTWDGCFRLLNEMEDSLVYDLYQGPKDTTFATVENTLDELESTLFTDIIMGKKDISAFDEFVTQWKQQGGDTLTETVNEWYKKQ